MRESQNEVDDKGFIRNGFDYDLQVWISNYKVQDLQAARDLNISGKDIRGILK